MISAVEARDLIYQRRDALRANEHAEVRRLDRLISSIVTAGDWPYALIREMHIEEARKEPVMVPGPECSPPSPQRMTVPPAETPKPQGYLKARRFDWENL